MSQAETMLLMMVGTGRVEMACVSGAVDGAEGLGAVELPPIAQLAEVAEAIASMTQLANAALSSKMVGQRGAVALRVLLSDRWLSEVSMPWDDAVLQRTHAPAIVRSRMQADGFEIDIEDVLKLEEGPYREPFQAVVYPAALLSALRAAAALLGARLQSVLPLSLAVATVAMTAPLRGGALAVLEDGAATFVRCVGPRVEVLQMQPSRSSGDLAVLWRRLGARQAAVAELSVLQVVDLSMGAWDVNGVPGANRLTIPTVGSQLSAALSVALATAALLHPLDAVSVAVPAPRRIQAAALLLGLGALWAVYGASQVVREVHRQQQDLASISAVAAPVERMEWTAAEQGRVRAVNVAIQELNLPISRLLSALQPPTGLAVLLLGVEVLPAASGGAQHSARLKVQAEGSSSADMAQYLAYLASRPAFASAYLVQHVVERQGGGAARYRFAIDLVAQQ